MNQSNGALVSVEDHYAATLDSKVPLLSVVFVSYAKVGKANPARETSHIVTVKPHSFTASCYPFDLDHNEEVKFAWAKTVKPGQTVRESLQEGGRMSDEGLALLGDIVLIPKDHIDYQGLANARPQ